jgi:3-deoxy-D-manno-octulosonate 8-phosphate phosphatase (KDO 8-P phosphatase)
MTDSGARVRQLSAFAFDVDGVLTDGTIYIGANGELMKAFSVHDGYAMVALIRTGIKLAIITGRRSAIVEQRAAELGIEIVHQGVADKAAALRGVALQLNLPLNAIGYMGDDWPDLPALRIAGFAATVGDAPAPLRQSAHWVASRPAGRGAVRELIDWIFAQRGIEPVAAP